MLPLALQVIDLRQEIADFEREHRHWPRSGSVSKPPRSCEPMPESEWFHAKLAELGSGPLVPWTLKEYRFTRESPANPQRIRA